jgi:hypothetical protein
VLQKYLDRAGECLADVKLKLRYLDSGKVLGFFGSLMEHINPKAIRAKLQNLGDEDTRLAVQSKLRLLSDLLSWPVNQFKSFLK